MSLFHTGRRLHSATENPLRLETPLGHVKFKVKINGILALFNSLSTLKSTESDSFLISEKSDSYEIDCLRVKFIPVLPSHMKVDKSFAFIWRIKALENLYINLT